MNKKPVLIIFISGIGIFLASAVTSFYWANNNPDNKDLQPRARKTSPSTKKSMNNSSERVSTDSDTPSSNWKQFLEYEGERRMMLGVKKKFSEVNFRTGPGLGFNVIYTPEGGELLYPLDRQGEWYRARLSDGRIGWISRQIVRQLKVPLPRVKQFRKNLPSLKKSTKALIPDSFKKYNRLEVIEPVINLRHGPGLSYNIKNKAYRYQELRLMAKRGEWYRVLLPGDIPAWVKSNLVREIMVQDDFSPDTITLKSEEVRYGPKSQFRKIIAGQGRTNATVIDVKKTWYQVQLHDGTIGWIKANNQKGVNRGNQSRIE